MCHQLECLRLTAILPLPLSFYPLDRIGLDLATQASFSNRFDTTKISSAYDVASFRSATVPLPSTPPSTASRGKVLQVRYNANPRTQPAIQTSFAEPYRRVPRLARPSYTEEQKFFIMYYRVVRKLSWPEIENQFASFFNLRTKDGLTSVYYRIRKTWGMDKVLATETSSVSARKLSESNASRFSKDFLEDLYFD